MDKVTLYRYPVGDYVERAGRLKKVDGVAFLVPKEWLIQHLKNRYNTTLDEFLDTYTWDWSTSIFREARDTGLL